MNLISICSRGNLAELKRAVADGANVDTPDATGRTALIEASWNGGGDLVRYLLDQGADPNDMDKSGFTAIMRAAEGGHLSCVNALIAKGADVNCRGHVRGTTPLMLAAENGHVRVISALLAAGANINAVDQYEETALARAHRMEQTKAAQLLASKGGRGRPERSNYSNNDREYQRHVTRASMPQWSGGGAHESDDDDFIA